MNSIIKIGRILENAVAPAAFVYLVYHIVKVAI